MTHIFLITVLLSLNVFAAPIDIHPGFSAITVNMTDADSVAIHGACNDEGRRNLIIVKAWKGSDTSLNPYVDSQIGQSCEVTEVDIKGECLVLEKDYSYSHDGFQIEPICKNKKFAFKVKLGAPSHDGTYLVRMKIRTFDGIVTDSLDRTVVIQRQ